MKICKQEIENINILKHMMSDKFDARWGGDTFIQVKNFGFYQDFYSWGLTVALRYTHFAK